MYGSVFGCNVEESNLTLIPVVSESLSRVLVYLLRDSKYHNLPFSETLASAVNGRFLWSTRDSSPALHSIVVESCSSLLDQRLLGKIGFSWLHIRLEDPDSRRMLWKERRRTELACGVPTSFSHVHTLLPFASTLSLVHLIDLAGQACRTNNGSIYHQECTCSGNVCLGIHPGECLTRQGAGRSLSCGRSQCTTDGTIWQV